MKIWELGNSRKTNQALGKFYVAFSIGIPGSKDLGMKYVPGAEFDKQGGPKSEMVYSITTREKFMNDYINQEDTKLMNSAYLLYLAILIYKKCTIFLLHMTWSSLQYNQKCRYTEILQNLYFPGIPGIPNMLKIIF